MVSEVLRHLWDGGWEEGGILGPASSGCGLLRALAFKALWGWRGGPIAGLGVPPPPEPERLSVSSWFLPDREIHFQEHLKLPSNGSCCPEMRTAGLGLAVPSLAVWTVPAPSLGLSWPICTVGSRLTELPLHSPCKARVAGSLRLGSCRLFSLQGRDTARGRGKGVGDVA